MTEKRFIPQGIDAVTGLNWRQGLTPARLITSRSGQNANVSDEHSEFADDSQSRSFTRIHLGPSFGIDPMRLEEAGWAVLFARDSDPAIRDALAPLLSLRRRQATTVSSSRYQELTIAPGESKVRFLDRHRAVPGPVDPERVPYYLLIVADPEDVPFGFQRQLDLQYAVGRLHFDTCEDYARYADSVVEAESGTLLRPLKAAFFGPSHQDDPASQLLSEHVVRPLVRSIASVLPDWQTISLLRENATKKRLLNLLTEEDPALLFAAGHGLVYPKQDDRQKAQQGSLLCQDWPGPRSWKGSILSEFCLSGDDLTDRTGLRGMIALLLSSFSVGTTKYGFSQSGTEHKHLSSCSFVSSLANSLLAQGVLAVWGTVADIWQLPSDLQTGRGAALESVIRSLADGLPIGFALEYLDQRFAELATDLYSEQEAANYGAQTNPLRLAALWSSYDELRNAVLLGDPAVRLPIKKTE